MRPRSLLVRYAAGLAFAYLTTAAEVVAIVVSLSGRRVVTGENCGHGGAADRGDRDGRGRGRPDRSPRRCAGSPRADRRPPTEAERQTALKTLRRQTAITFAPWVLTAAGGDPVESQCGSRDPGGDRLRHFFGAIATVCTGFLFTLRTLRPVLAGVPTDLTNPIAPGVRARLLLMWTVCTALPGVAIALLLIMRSRHWIIDENTPIELALLVLALVAVILGLRAMILVSISISDPVGEVVAAMADVEHGRIDRTIDVYEWSESGACKGDSTAWSPACGNATGCEICSAAMSARKSCAAPCSRTNHCPATSARWPRSSTTSSGSWSPRSTSGTV